MSAFDLQPTLTGKSIGLRPLSSDDFEALYQIASDPLIWEQHPEANRYQRPVFEGFFKLALESMGAFAVFNPTTHEIMGSSRYYDLDLSQNLVAIGYTFLARKFWGGEFNHEMKTLMIDHAFRFVDKIHFHVDEKNFRSQKALEKIGIKNKTRVEKFKQRSDGSWESSLVYELKKSEITSLTR
jgi:RimJ/RimL family protein N-acetyltransferase